MALRVAVTGSLLVLGLMVRREIRRHARTAATLAAREAEFRLLAEGSSDLVLRLDLDGRIRYASPAAERVLGAAPEAIVGSLLGALADRQDADRVAAVLADLGAGRVAETKVTFRRAADAEAAGGARWLDVSLRISAAGDEQALVAVARDHTEAEETTLRLASEASTDVLTGLANRRQFDGVLAAEWRRAERQGASLALLFVDVDRFKAFNDRYGHQGGDACLVAVAAAIRAVAKRPGDVVARYGGEEFVVLLPGTDVAGAVQVAEAVRRAVQDLAVRHDGNGRIGVVTVSIGVAAQVPDGQDGERDHLTRRADLALYAAKNAGRNRVVAAEALVPDDDVAWSGDDGVALPLRRAHPGG